MSNTINDVLAKELARRAQARLADLNRLLRETIPGVTAKEIEILAPYFVDANRCLRIITEGTTEADAKWLVWKTE